MLPWKLRKCQMLPVSQNLSSVYFSYAKFQLVSCDPSLAIIWQVTYTHKLPKLCSATLSCIAVFLLFKIWKKPTKNCLIFQSALTFYVLIQQAAKIKPSLKNSQVARFTNLSEDQLQQILAERHSLGAEKTPSGH